VACPQAGEVIRALQTNKVRKHREPFLRTSIMWASCSFDEGMIRGRA
jgi:hypothetical protein